jgi:hypothetical protein
VGAALLAEAGAEAATGAAAVDEVVDAAAEGPSTILGGERDGVAVNAGAFLSSMEEDRLLLLVLPLLLLLLILVVVDTSSRSRLSVLMLFGLSKGPMRAGREAATAPLLLLSLLPVLLLLELLIVLLFAPLCGVFTVALALREGATDAPGYGYGWWARPWDWG